MTDILKIHQRYIGSGLKLVIRQIHSPLRLSFHVENDTADVFNLIVDLSQSRNLRFEKANSINLEKRIEPYDMRYLDDAVHAQNDGRGGWKLAYETKLSKIEDESGDGEVDSSLHAQDGIMTEINQESNIEPKQANISEDDDHEDSNTDDDQDVSIFSQQDPNNDKVVYVKAKNRSYQAYKIQVYICSVHTFENGEVSASATCDPYADNCIIGSIFKSSKASLKYVTSMKKCEPTGEYLENSVKSNRQSVLHDIEAYKRSNLYYGDDHLNIHELQCQCKEDKVKFIDLEFLPISSSLFTKASIHFDDTVTWRRAGDFMDQPMKLFESSIDPCDIQQGKLGDCWLLSSIAALAEFPNKVLELFDSELQQSCNDVGVYEVTLYKHGQKRRFRLDDYFPCLAGAGPIYAQNNGNELWVMLLEKAFAKMYGCYDLLRGGFAYEALMDLTGCPTETLRLSHNLDAEALWNSILKHDQLENIMTASVSGEDKWSNSNHTNIGGVGLVSGHAYSLISAYNTSDGVRLLKFRNPWGDTEWKGRWSDDSSDWTDTLKREVGAEFDVHDGIFFMQFEDVIRYFQRFNICHLNSSEGKPWNSIRGKSFFEFNPKHVDYGHVSVSPFELEITHETEAWIVLHQEDERGMYKNPYLSIGFALYYHDKSADEQVLMEVIRCEEKRQVQHHFSTLKAGRYTIVPLTLGIHRHSTGQTRPKNAPVHDKQHPELLSHEYMSIALEIFRRYDTNMDGFLDGDELKYFISKLKKISEDQVDVEEFCRGLDVRQGSGLTRDGLVGFFQNLDETKILECLENLGYQDLMLENERVFVLSCHATCDMSFKKLDSDQFLIDRTFKDIFLKMGMNQNSPTNLIRNFSLLHKACHSFAVENVSDKNQRVSFVFNKFPNVNLQTHHQSPICNLEVPAGDMRFVHVQPMTLSGQYGANPAIIVHAESSCDSK